MAIHVVTGGAGFIGSHLSKALVRRGDAVRVVDDLSSGGLANLQPLDVGPPGSGAAVEFFHGDVLDGSLLRRAMDGASGVFHHAAQVSVPASLEDPVQSYRINVMGTLSVLEAARACRVRRVVYAASSAAYGDDPTLPKREDMDPRPLSPYASGKLAGEVLLAVWGRSFGLETVALRYFNVYGPGQSDSSPYSGVIALFARSILAGRAPTIHGDGAQTRDFVFVEDVAQANLLAMDRPLEPGTVINVGTGLQTSIGELYQRMAALSGFSEEAKRAAARPGDVPHSVASIERATEALGYRPSVDLGRGLALTLDWYRGRS